MKRVFLVSGGLDSFIAYKLFSKKGDVALFVDYGQKYAEQEQETAKSLFSDLEIIKVDGKITELEKNYIPNRNLLLATIASTYFLANEIHISGLKSDNCLDKNPKVFDEYSELLTKFSKRETFVVSDLWEFTKGSAVLEYINNGYDKDELLKTYSCYEGGIVHCGKCSACRRRVKTLEILK